MLLDLSGDWRRQKEFEKLMSEYLRTKCDGVNHTVLPPKKTHKGNGKPNGLFAGTLTVASSDDISEADLLASIRKIFSQKTCPVKRYAWYLEYTEAGKPHIHFLYETEKGGRIHAKVFMRYHKTWDESVKLGKGHRGGYHKLVDSEIAYGEYIAKDGGIGESKGFSEE